jgi:hypothetical protein
MSGVVIFKASYIQLLRVPRNCDQSKWRPVPTKWPLIDHYNGPSDPERPTVCSWPTHSFCKRTRSDGRFELTEQRTLKTNHYPNIRSAVKPWHPFCVLSVTVRFCETYLSVSLINANLQAVAWLLNSQVPTFKCYLQFSPNKTGLVPTPGQEGWPPIAPGPGTSPRPPWVQWSTNNLLSPTSGRRSTPKRRSTDAKPLTTSGLLTLSCLPLIIKSSAQGYKWQAVK